MRPNLTDSVLDAMAAARDVRVRSIAANKDGVDYEITLTIRLDRKTWEAISETAGKRRQRITSLLRNYAAKGLRHCLARDDDDDRAVAA